MSDFSQRPTDNRDHQRIANIQARSQMMYDAQRKSVGLGYVLWFFLGGLGVHRFYLGRTGSGVAQLLLGLLGWLPLFAGWVVLGIWLLVDLFLIPSIATSENSKLAYHLTR
jgi:TM2 domain-containing membrane protein YozV